MSNSVRPQETGRLAEQMTARILQSKGFSLVTSNFAVPDIGEIDLVMIRDQTLLIIEVKARRKNSNYGGAEQAITQRKIMRIRRTAAVFCRRYGFINDPVCFAASLVSINQAGKMTGLEWVPF